MRTFYLGKKRGKYANTYIQDCPRPSKVQKMSSVPCYHIEFTLNGAQTICRALNIQHDKETGCQRGLRSATEMFWHREDKYLAYHKAGEPDFRGFNEPKAPKWGLLNITQERYDRLSGRL